MKSFKQYLEEKSVRGMEIQRYLVNPTVMELVSFQKSTKMIRFRTVWNDGKLYVWEAYKMIHVDFMRNELFIDYNEARNMYANGSYIGVIAFPDGKYLGNKPFISAGMYSWKNNKKFYTYLAKEIGLTSKPRKEPNKMFIMDDK